LYLDKLNTNRKPLVRLQQRSFLFF